MCITGGCGKKTGGHTPKKPAFPKPKGASKPSFGSGFSSSSKAGKFGSPKVNKISFGRKY